MIYAHTAVVFFLASMWWMTSSCAGRAVVDLEKDGDEDWPVLCPPNTFYHRGQETCKICSKCPPNKIITRPCHGLYDTECGPFYDFKNLQPAPEPNNDNGESNAFGSSDDVKMAPSVKADQSEAGNNRLGESDKMSAQDQTASDNLESSESEWRLLTLTLSVLISVTFIVFVIIGICLIRRRVRGDGKKQLVCEYRPPPVEV